MVVWRKCPICGDYYKGDKNGGLCKCGFKFGHHFKPLKFILSFFYGIP